MNQLIKLISQDKNMKKQAQHKNQATKTSELKPISSIKAQVKWADPKVNLKKELIIKGQKFKTLINRPNLIIMETQSDGNEKARHIKKHIKRKKILINNKQRLNQIIHN